MLPSIMVAPFGERRLARTIVALLTPVVAVVLMNVFWRDIQPHVWFLLYPAVFISSWLGGRRLGTIATALSAFLVWWLFLRKASVVLPEPRDLMAVGVFFATGAAFAIFHDRLTRATAAAAGKIHWRLP
jgi:hypothetical protein